MAGDDAQNTVTPSDAAPAAAPDATKAGDAANGGTQTKPQTAEEWQAYAAKLEADKEGLNKALHNERKNKGAKAAPDAEQIASELEKVKTQLETAEKRGKMSRYTQDDAEVELALTYYNKLADGVTDATEQEKLMQRAAFLAKADKGGATDPMNKVTSAMHGGSRGTTDTGTTPGVAAMAQVFGLDASRVKDGNRPPKGLYNA